MKRKPKIIGGNRYYFLGKELKICWSCGFPMMNNKSGHGKTCKVLNQIDRNDLSECQVAKNSYVAKQARLKYKAEGRTYMQQFDKKALLPKKDIQKRVCLKCDRLFKSEGKFNRVCERCSKIQEAIVPLGIVKVGSDIKIEGSKWYD